MTPEHGVFEAKILSLDAICTRGSLEFDRSGRCFEFGFRWENGEVAEDVLVLDTDGYYDGPDNISHEGNTYRLEFGEEDISDILRNTEAIGPSSGLPASISLRYYYEFDAYFDPDDLRIGGRWSWGGMRGRKERRNPEEFIAHWVGNARREGGENI